MSSRSADVVYNIRVSLADLLVSHPFDDDAPLLHTIERSVTAGEARRAAATSAKHLGDAGVESGQPVAVQLPNGPDMVTTMFGVWLAGAVFVPVNWRAPEPEVERALRTVGAAALVRPDGIHVLDGGTRCEPDAAFVQWTSGTTGEAKAILHTHAAYLELLDRVLGELRPSGRGRERPPMPNLVPVSLALNAGIYNVLFGLRAGAPIVIMERFETGVFAELVRRFGIRSTVLPPAAITMLTDDEKIGDLAPLRYVRSITAPLPPVEARRFADRFGVMVLNGYGQAEIGEVIGWTAADAREHPEKVGAVGRPHAGVQIKVVGDDDGPLPEGQVGELTVRPPRMASGYLGGGGLADRLDAEGYLRTGDLARVDSDGFVWIESRVSDVIDRGGNKVLPAQVEEALRNAPGVRDAAVVGAPTRGSARCRWRSSSAKPIPATSKRGAATSSSRTRCRWPSIASTSSRATRSGRCCVASCSRRSRPTAVSTSARRRRPRRSSLLCTHGSTTTCRTRGVKRRSAAVQRRSARSGREPSTRSGTRCSRVLVSSCRRGRSLTAASI